MFLEIGHMPDLPQKGIDGAQKRYAKLFVGQIVNHIQRSAASIDSPRFKRGGGKAVNHISLFLHVSGLNVLSSKKKSRCARPL